MGKKIPVEYQQYIIGGYSSHADQPFARLSRRPTLLITLKKFFVTHGELKSSSFLVQRLSIYLGIGAVATAYG